MNIHEHEYSRALWCVRRENVGECLVFKFIDVVRELIDSQSAKSTSLSTSSSHSHYNTQPASHWRSDDLAANITEATGIVIIARWPLENNLNV